ncbi:MAG: GAF domain-containing sensor histidine kinase [Aggregatilineales bacterium]
MTVSNENVEGIEHLVNELRQQHARNPEEVEQALTDVLALFRNVDARPQPAQETVERMLRKANQELEMQLQSQLEENKRSQRLEREQRALTEALRDTMATISTTLDLNKVLDQILDTVGRVTPYDGANVLFVESDLVHVVRQRGYVEKGQEEAWLNQRIPITKLAVLQQMMDLGKPVAIPDTSTSSMWIGFPELEWIHSNVIVPIRLKDKVLGFLSLDSATPGFFTQVHAERLQTFADQAAIAIQNARLYDRAKRAAILAERNRLANELHDTISQTLWSISLITERLPIIWEIDRAEGQRSLTTLYQLAQSALAEMRSLLLELRPSELTDAKLGDLIQQLAAVIANRTGLTFSVKAEMQDPLPPDVQVILYRVMQEALNNIVLHASATHVEIYFCSQSGHVELTVQDNGRGFDPAHIALGHLGLSIMNDRIVSIGGAIETISQHGDGTLIKVSWDNAHDAERDTMI